MSNERKQRYLYIDGQAVPVSEQVYHAYWHYTAKEDYFTRQLKAERFSTDQDAQTVDFTPSREDSLDRLLAMDKQFAAQDTPVEEQAISSLWMKELLEGLTEEERQIVYQLYFLERSERQACAAMNPQNPQGVRRQMEESGRGFALREAAERIKANKWLLEHADITVKDPNETPAAE